MGFQQYHVQQLDGSDNQGRNCAAASLATQIRILTDNKLKPRPEQLRDLIDDARDTAGLTGTQVKEAYWDFLKPRWKPVWGKIPGFRLHQNDEWNDFVKMLDGGYTAHTQLQYSEVPIPYRRRLSTFQGPHAVLTIKHMKKDGVQGFLVSDPLKGKPMFWPASVMKAAAFKRSGDGFIDAAYVPRVIDPPDVPDNTPDPVDEIPVPEPKPPVDEVARLSQRVLALTEERDRARAASVALGEQVILLELDGSAIREIAREIADRPLP